MADLRAYLPRPFLQALAAGVAATAMTSACGSIDTAPAVACDGTELRARWYQSSNNEMIEVAANCRFTSTLCAVTGTVTALDTTARTLSITALTSGYPSSPGCSISASRTCSYTLSGTTLTLTCSPEGSGTYERQ